MYADYAYYSSGYLLGKSPAVPETEFLFWEKQARLVVDDATQGRISKNSTLINNDVKDCTCAITELLYKADKLNRSGDVPGMLVSYNNDGDSGTFDISQSAYTEDGIKRKTAQIIGKYLGKTGLTFAGGICYER